MKSSTLALYEGLPHQLYEEEALESELRSKRTTKLHGFPFYQETLPLAEADAERLRAALGDSATYKVRNLNATKLCGGFHPDYCVEWQGEGGPCRALVCFGCFEVNLHTPGADYFLDVSQQAVTRLREILKPYRKNRPVEPGK
jgi:hypothetical protein